jgi:hypothetical protein
MLKMLNIHDITFYVRGIDMESLEALCQLSVDNKIHIVSLPGEQFFDKFRTLKNHPIVFSLEDHVVFNRLNETVIVSAREIDDMTEVTCGEVFDFMRYEPFVEAIKMCRKEDESKKIKLFYSFRLKRLDREIQNIAVSETHELIGVALNRKVKFYVTREKNSGQFAIHCFHIYTKGKMLKTSNK